MHLLLKLLKLFFYSNYFIGLCAVALCVETNLQHNLPFNGKIFYTLVLLGTATYYNYVYMLAIPKTKYSDDRIDFYRENEKLVRTLHWLNIIICIILAGYLFVKYFDSFIRLTNIKWGLIAIFPLAAISYTFQVLPFPHLRKLRRIGWAKPFILGFVWSGIVTVYPIIFYQVQLNYDSPVFSFPSGWLWLKNWMFISLLCVMFDIKDYETDKRNNLRTYAVQLGINKTISMVIVPLVIVGLISFYIFTISKGLPTVRIAFNTIPYLLLIVSAYSLQRKRPVIFYLAFIDGLMIIKAICGILGTELIKI